MARRLSPCARQPGRSAASATIAAAAAGLTRPPALDDLEGMEGLTQLAESVRREAAVALDDEDGEAVVGHAGVGLARCGRGDEAGEEPPPEEERPERRQGGDEHGQLEGHGHERGQRHVGLAPDVYRPVDHMDPAVEDELADPSDQAPQEGGEGQALEPLGLWSDEHERPPPEPREVRVVPVDDAGCEIGEAW